MGWVEIASFIVGSSLGALICYFSLTRKREESTVERQMRELQEEFTVYRENVNQHFHKTADLVNNLSESYISVQKHLENAASTLTEPPKSFSIDESSHTALLTTKPEFNSLNVQISDDEDDADFSDAALAAPRDYAPPHTPQEPGTLDESFGLHEKEDTPPSVS